MGIKCDGINVFQGFQLSCDVVTERKSRYIGRLRCRFCQDTFIMSEIHRTEISSPCSISMNVEIESFESKLISKGKYFLNIVNTTLSSRTNYDDYHNNWYFLFQTFIKVDFQRFYRLASFIVNRKIGR